LHIEALLEALSAGSTRRVSLARDHTALVRRGRIELFAPQNDPIDEPSVDELSQPSFEFSSIPGAVLRTRLPGDRITLSGGRRKLSDVLIDLGVPRERRDRLSVLAVGAEVLWLGVSPPLFGEPVRSWLEPAGSE